MTEINRYNNGKIYKLVSNQTDKIYIGSTCKERLCQRLAQHKRNYNFWLKDNNNGYMSSYELFKLGNVEIVLLETINCNTKDELLKKEREYIDKYKDILINKVRPTITKDERKEYQKEHYEDNKEEIKEKKKQYYEKNKDDFLEKSKKYREEHKDERKQYVKNYNVINKEKIKEKRKDYFKNYHEQNKEKNKETMDCACGSNFRKTEKLRHERTIKHQNYINSLNQPILET